MEFEAEIVVLQNGLRVQIVLGLDDRRSETNRVFATEAVSAEWSRGKLEHMQSLMIDRCDLQKYVVCDLAVLKASSLMTMDAGDSVPSGIVMLDDHRHMQIRRSD